MTWADSVPAIVHAWYLGNATGDAIADVLFGKVNPSGKLPITFPARLEDVPSFGHFNVDDGKILHPAYHLYILNLLCWCRFDTPKIFSLSVDLLTAPYLSFLRKFCHEYKHYHPTRI